MAINKNHEFEELDGVKCGIVEKSVAPQRVLFLKDLLQTNGFTVVMVPSPPPKAVPDAKAEDGTEITVVKPEPVIETFTVGVTDYTFNAINAIFGRLLKTKDGHIVTLAYWQQQQMVSNDEVPYFEEVSRPENS
jgi:hypothetical protein